MVRKGLLLVFICLNVYSGFSQPLTSTQYREDVQYLWETIRTNYAYWNKKAIDWNKALPFYLAQADTVSSKWYFTLTLERMLNELYDHHISLNTNTSESQRLVPTGTDLWAEWQNGKAVVIDVRRMYGAFNAGVRPGMEVLSVNDIPVEKAIQVYLPVFPEHANTQARNYALNILLAGRHSAKRKLTVQHGAKIVEFNPDGAGAIQMFQYNGLIESKTLTGNIGYIRINNSLGDNRLIPLFDSVLNQLLETKAMILDLRETPSGGNTTVARGIMGRFIEKEGFYQKHVLLTEEQRFGVRRSWMELVSTRGVVYKQPLVILVNHWTGSVGEGIAIGFDALKRARIVGTPMAGLNGAMYSYQMPHSKIGFSIPVEQLYHVNGTPREAFRPTLLVTSLGDKDAILEAALTDLTRKSWRSLSQKK